MKSNKKNNTQPQKISPLLLQRVPNTSSAGFMSLLCSAQIIVVLDLAGAEKILETVRNRIAKINTVRVSQGSGVLDLLAVLICARDKVRWLSCEPVSASQRIGQYRGVKVSDMRFTVGVEYRGGDVYMFGTGVLTCRGM